MKKNLFLFITALLSLFAMQASAEAYAIWCEGNTTLYFISSTKSYAAGGTYDGQKITEVWKGNDVTQKAYSWEIWSSTIKDAVTRAVFDESFKDVKVNSTAYWFSYCKKLQSIEGLRNLNTANVTTMSCMFDGCSGLTSLDVSKFNTAKVTDMSLMFMGCSGLTSLDVSKFNTANVTKMYGMFEGCSSLTSLDVSNFNTANVTMMMNIFYDCSGLTSIDVSNFNTAKVTDLSHMFVGCSGLTSLDVSNFNTANVTDMGGMFGGCSGLTSLDVSIFNTANVTTMTGMFAGCSSLTSLNLSNFNTANVTTMAGMFQDCSGLTSLDVSNFNTANVTDMAFMFQECSGLTSLDLSNFNTANVTTMHYMFFGCSQLKTIIVGDGWKLYLKDPADNWMFFWCLNLVGGKGTVYDDNITDARYARIDGGRNNPGYLSDNTAIVNKVSLNKSEVVVRKGKTVTLKATVTPETLEDKSVTWKSSDKTIATVSSDGVVTGVKSGVVTITCTSNATGAKTTCKVTVGTITLDKKEVIIRKKKTITLTPTVYPTTLEDKSVKWKTSDKSIATVSNTGVVKGVKSGVVTITCTSNATGLSATCKVTVGTITLNKSSVTVDQGKTVTLTPTVYPTTLEDKTVKWKSSDKSVATVTSAGKVKGVKAGVATITCTSNATGLSTTCTVTVPGIALDQSEVILRKKKTLTLTPIFYPETQEDKSVTWKSSDKSVATVSSSGKVTGVKSGVVTITCTSNATGLSTTCKVTVGTITLNKSEVIVRKKKTVTLTTTVYPTTLEDKSVTWKSSDESVATVSSDGVVTGIKSGVITITCTSNATGLSTTCKVTVATIALNKSSVTITKGESVTLKPTVYPTTLEDKSVTWKSSKTSVAKVSSAGKVKGIAAGTATITCTAVATGVSTTCKVTVKAASARTLDGDDEELTDIEIVEMTPAVEEPFDVYDLRGHQVLHQVTSLDALPAGVYIVKGKKVMKK